MKMSYWWVNQGKSYKEERPGGYLKAPHCNEQGMTRSYWTNMKLLKVGDQVFHYANNHLRAIGIVTKKAQEIDNRPEENRVDELFGMYWVAQIAMEELDHPIHRKNIPPEVREKAGSEGPYDRIGGIKQAYLLPLRQEAGLVLQDALMKLPRKKIDHVLPAFPGEPITTEIDKETAFSGMTIYDQIAEQGFCFPDWLVTDYILALGTKPFVILSGISGTGKTKLAQIVAQIVAPDEEIQSVIGDLPKAENGSFIHTVGLSTLKYRGLTLPVDSLTLFNNLPEKGEGVDVAIQRPDGGKYKGRIANVNFTDSSRSTVFRLFWEKDLGTWLTENSSIGDYLLITPLGSIESQAVVMELHKATRISKRISSPRIAFLSVRPDWTDNRSLLGYYNPLTGQYQSTELLSLLLKAKADPDKPHFVILDEMNLAKVEYYFSDFLSAMEAGTDMILHDSKIDLFLDDEESMKIPRRISVPRNVFFSGTVNVDETTYMFSPKVLDRSNVIEFNEVNLQNYPINTLETGEFRLLSKMNIEEILEAAQPPSSDDWVNLQNFYKDRLRQVHDLLAPYNLHFGYRVVNEIACFMNLAARFVEEKDLGLAFDLQLLQKVFPKLAGNRAKLEKPLEKLLEWCNSPNSPKPIDSSVESDEPKTPTYSHSAAKLTRMLKTLKTTGFVSFVE